MRHEQLASLLKSTSRWILFTETLRAICAGLGVLLVAGLLALAVDAVLALAAWGLIAVDLCLLALIAAAAGYTFWQIYRNLFNPRRIARLVEERLGIRDSRLINAIDLTEGPLTKGQSRATSSALVERSISEGETLAGTLCPRSAVRFGPMFKMALAAAGVMLVVLGSFLAAPRVFARVLPRYLDPTGDHPPYTLVNFQVRVSPEAIYQGKPATITAELSGPDLPDQANVVFLGETRQQLPMFRSVDGSFVMSVERAEETREFFIDTPKGRSERFTLPVLAVPLIESAHAAYEFPSYTGWPASAHVLDARGIRAIQGTQITITAKSNMRLGSGLVELVRIHEGQESPPVAVALTTSAGDPKTVSGKFPLEFNGRYRLTVIGANGAPCREALEGSLNAAPDNAPRIEFISPEPQVVAVEDWKVPVSIRATDDVAIDRIVLQSSINGWGPSPTALTLHFTEKNLARADYDFDLSTLGARPGDIITYYATAYDNHPREPQFADTAIYVIQVISKEEYLDFARTQYRMDQITEEVAGLKRKMAELKSQRDKVLEKLERLKKKVENGEQLSDEEQKQMADLENELAAFEKAAKELARDLKQRAEQPQLYDFEQPYQEMLKTLSRQLEQQAANAENARQKTSNLRKQPGGSPQRQEFKAAGEKLAEEKEPFDEESMQDLDGAAQDLDQMKMADDLLAQAERLKAVIEQQRDLADRMAEFRNQEQLSPEDQQRAQRLAKEQDLLRDELEETAKSLEQCAKQAAEKLPKMSESAMKLCKALGEMQVPGEQGAAAKSARAGSGKKAFESADSAAEKLESLMSQMCNAEGAAGEMSMDGPLNLSKDGLKRSLQQLSQGRSIPGMGKKGGDGSGFSGSKPRVAVMGPHLPTGSPSESRSGRGGPDGPGSQSLAGRENDPRGAESLNPAARIGRASSAGNMRGVPVGYRDQAEAYFKRIAEEK